MNRFNELFQLLLATLPTATWSLYTDLDIEYQERKLAKLDAGFEKATYLYIAARRLPEPHAMKYIADWWETIHVDIDKLNKEPKKGMLDVNGVSTTHFLRGEQENIWVHVVLPYLIASKIKPSTSKIPVLPIFWAREKHKFLLDKLPSEHIGHYMCNWELPSNYLNLYTSQLDLAIAEHIPKLDPYQKNLFAASLLHHCDNSRIGMSYLERMLPDVASTLTMLDTQQLEDQINYMHFQIETDAHNSKALASTIPSAVFETDV